jgi:hypothetical protein
MRVSILNAKYYPTAKQFEQAISAFFDTMHLRKAELKQSIGLKFQITI